MGYWKKAKEAAQQINDSYMAPEEFQNEFYAIFAAEGVTLDPRRPKCLLTDGFICGETVEDMYNGCQVGDVIQLDKSLYNAATNATRKCLLLHEMGHWAGLPHKNTLSIMYFQTLTDRYFLANYEALKKELVRDYKILKGIPV